jgi:hypothetical protein
MIPGIRQHTCPVAALGAVFLLAGLLSFCCSGNSSSVNTTRNIRKE